MHINMGTGSGRAQAAVPTSSSHAGPIALIQIAVDQRAEGRASSRFRRPSCLPYPPSDGGRGPSRPFRAVLGFPLVLAVQASTRRSQSAETLRPDQGRPSGYRRTGRVPGTARQSRVPARCASASTAHPPSWCPSKFVLSRIAPRRFLVSGQRASDCLPLASAPRVQLLLNSVKVEGAL